MMPNRIFGPELLIDYGGTVKMAVGALVAVVLVLVVLQLLGLT
jgi:hypothetical protein